MRAGKAIRDDAALRAAYAKPCDECGHPLGGHFEIRYSKLEIVDGELVETVDPDHRAGEFHCRAAGCACVNRSGL